MFKQTHSMCGEEQTIAAAMSLGVAFQLTPSWLIVSFAASELKVLLQLPHSARNILRDIGEEGHHFFFASSQKILRDIDRS